MQPKPTLRSLLRGDEGRLALVIGNGIHRHRAAASGNDWNQMMQNLAAKYGVESSQHQIGLALTELYDLIDLRTPAEQKPHELQAEFCERMDEWKPLDHHHRIMDWAARNDAPVLTTNFDHVLSNSVGARLQSLFRPRGSVKGPTDYYPWEKYFGINELNGPCDGFGVWHINGLIEHTRSIRLGLSHYMGSVSRARPWLHGSKETRLFSQKDMPNWRGRDTWLHIVFNMPMLIFGLKLEGQEVFLRWLLIERAKYFRQFPERRQPAWYVSPTSENAPEDLAKKFFLQSLRIEPVDVIDYDAIYEAPGWIS